MNKNLNKIVEILREIPGISTKLAERLSIQIIEKPEISNKLENIINISSGLEKDEITGLIIPKGSTANEGKEKDVLLILESNKDLLNLINKTNSLKSIFILGIENKRDFQNTNAVLKRLFKVIKDYRPKEVLFLLTPSIESELIMRVIKEEIVKIDIKKVPELTRLSMGIPFGGSIEFSDERTIKEAMNKREKA